jgi:hypothetical protein
VLERKRNRKRKSYEDFVPVLRVIGASTRPSMRQSHLTVCLANPKRRRGGGKRGEDDLVEEDEEEEGA